MKTEVIQAFLNKEIKILKHSLYTETSMFWFAF